jgi:urea transport system permease protein
VNWAKTTFSEEFPQLWLLAMGGLFIGVVSAFPNGLAGLYATYVEPRIDSLFARAKGASGAGSGPAITPAPAHGTPAE